MNNVRLKFTFEALCVFVLIVLLFAVRYRQFVSTLKSIEGDEFAWVTSALFEKHNILPSEKGLWEMNDAVAKSFPTSLKINQLGFYIFGTDIYSARKMLALLNILSMLTFYLLCRRFFSPIVSFCTAILYSFSAYKLISARIAVEPAYADLFLYLFIVLILSISVKNSWLNYVYSLLAVLGIILGTFAYSLSFFFPVLGIVLLIIQLAKNKLKLREKMIIFLIFTIPLIISIPKWINNIKLESVRKDYALGQVVFDLDNKQFNAAKFYTNIYIIHKNLFRRLADRSADMLVYYRDTIIPPLIVYLTVAGVILSLFKIKKYYPLQIWFGLSFIPMVLFGMYAARMWINLVGVLFIFSGITIQSLLNLKEIKSNKFTDLFLYLFLLFVVYSSLYEYYHFAINNTAFYPKIGELVKISREFKGNLTSDIAFISDEEYSQGTIYPAATFYYLSQHPEEEEKIKYMTREEMLVFSYDYFIESEQFNLHRYKYVVADNIYSEEVSNIIKSNTNRSFKKHDYAYFSLYEFDLM